MSITRDLYIVRHAKSDWSTGPTSDFDRSLSERGHSDAPRLGQWVKSHGIVPDILISSPARRAAQTTTAITQHIRLPAENVIYDQRLYLASVPTLIDVVGEINDHCQSLMLVGHNPGLESLVLQWCADPLPYTTSGKLLTTANFVHLQFQQAWGGIGDQRGRLKHFIRPRDLR